MKGASPELIALLQNRGSFLTADCFTFTLRDGRVLRYTSADVDITLDGETYLAHSVLVSGLRYTISLGLDVDEQDIQIIARDEDTVDGVPFLVALRALAFDSCYIQRTKAFLTAWDQPAVGGVVLFHGRISTVDKIGATVADVKVKNDLVLLDQDFPRRIYQPSCLHTFCDGQCGLSKPALAAPGAATGGDYATIAWGGATEGKFDQGTVTFQTGENANVSATIKQSTGAALILMYPLEFPVVEGDAFTAYPGCAHTQAACQAFNNVAHFLGYPYVPPPETAY